MICYEKARVSGEKSGKMGNKRKCSLYLGETFIFGREEGQNITFMANIQFTHVSYIS